MIHELTGPTLDLLYRPRPVSRYTGSFFKEIGFGSAT